VGAEALIDVITSAQPKSARHLAVAPDAEELERYFPPRRTWGIRDFDVLQGRTGRCGDSR